MYSCNIQNMNFDLRLQSALRHHLLPLKTMKCEALLPPVGSLGAGFCNVFWLLDGLVSHLHIVLLFR